MAEPSPRSAELPAAEPHYISPIARPRLGGTALVRSLKLVKRALAVEKLAKQARSEGAEPPDLVLTRLVKRGVQDVTKALRKGLTGVVLIASDVHPVDVVAHVPVLCEELAVAYAFVGPKRVLSDVCHSKRPTCVVLVAKPANDFPRRVAALAADPKLDYSELYAKVDANIRKHHPFL